MLWGEQFTDHWFEKNIGFRYSAILPTKVFFGVGSVEINQDMSLLDQISLQGGIRHSSNRFLFRVGSLPLLYCKYLYNGICQYIYMEKTFDRFFSIQYVDVLSMPQVFEQSLFLLTTALIRTPSLST